MILFILYDTGLRLEASHVSLEGSRKEFSRGQAGLFFSSSSARNKNAQRNTRSHREIIAAVSNGDLAVR